MPPWGEPQWPSVPTSTEALPACTTGLFNQSEAVSATCDEPAYLATVSGQTAGSFVLTVGLRDGPSRRRQGAISVTSSFPGGFSSSGVVLGQEEGGRRNVSRLGHYDLGTGRGTDDYGELLCLAGEILHMLCDTHNGNGVFGTVGKCCLYLRPQHRP